MFKGRVVFSYPKVGRQETVYYDSDNQYVMTNVEDQDAQGKILNTVDKIDGTILSKTYQYNKTGQPTVIQEFSNGALYRTLNNEYRSNGILQKQTVHYTNGKQTNEVYVVP